MTEKNESMAAPDAGKAVDIPCKLDEKSLETLIFAIQCGKCILMLGPDASVYEENGTRRPLTEILANELSENISPGFKQHIDTSNLAQVSQYYINESRKLELQATVRRFYRERQGLTSSLHRDLAALPFYFTITTTLDNLFINALIQEKKKPFTGWYNFTDSRQVPVESTGDIKNPLVFYLYGNIQEPDSLLLAESDLLEFLVALISRKPGLQDKILSELKDDKKSFLFFGFGFRHWYLRILLHVLMLKGNRKHSRSFALEQFTPANISDLKDTVFFFKNNDCRIHIFKENFKQFVSKLRQEYKEYSPPCNSRIEEALGAKVFICYANENKEHAAKLSKKLEEAGLRPWRDKEKLRGGDRWNSCIEETISKVDYFVVLQSKAMNNRIEGYFNREIKKALIRQDCFRAGIRFIIPVKIEECELKQDLEGFHVIDFTEENNIKTLIDAIEQDSVRRKEK